MRSAYLASIYSTLRSNGVGITNGLTKSILSIAFRAASLIVDRAFSGLKDIAFLTLRAPSFSFSSKAHFTIAPSIPGTNAFASSMAVISPVTSTVGTRFSPKPAMFRAISPIFRLSTQIFLGNGQKLWASTPPEPAIPCKPCSIIASNDSSYPTGPASPACITNLHSACNNSTLIPPGNAP